MPIVLRPHKTNSPLGPVAAIMGNLFPCPTRPRLKLSDRAAEPGQSP